MAFCFFALGDTGRPTDRLRETAATMAQWAERLRPAHVLLLGDNFYPAGVRSTSDGQFQSGWAHIFLEYASLRVPWKVCLGNHDYMGTPQAQIDFSSSSRNPGGLWQCPGQNYSFSHELPGGQRIEFFALDTNGCQGHVRKAFPEMEKNLSVYVEELDERLRESSAAWKVVFGHHPMYTKSRRHGRLANCLRESRYAYYDESRHQLVEREGYGLEEVLVRNGACAYFSGHEHLFEQHSSGGLGHFVCGSSGAEGPGLYGGEAGREHAGHPLWADGSRRHQWKDGSHGFAVAVVDAANDRMLVAFVAAPLGRVVRLVSRRLQGGEWAAEERPEEELEEALGVPGLCRPPPSVEPQERPWSRASGQWWRQRR